jgi:hypothetical protein
MTRCNRDNVSTTFQSADLQYFTPGKQKAQEECRFNPNAKSLAIF